MCHCGDEQPWACADPARPPELCHPGRIAQAATSFGHLPTPGELLALLITSIHLEKRLDHQKLPSQHIGPTAVHDPRAGVDAYEGLEGAETLHLP